MARYRLSAVVEKGEKFFVSRCVELGVVSQGKTVDEAITNLKEAAELYLKHAEPAERASLKTYQREEPIMTTILVTG